MTPETKDEKSLPRGVGGVSALWSAARNPPADATARFDGQTILILGATSGVGHEAAIKFATRGAARIIIGARDLSRAKSTIQAISSRSPLLPDAFEALEVDLASFESVRDFIKNLERLEPVDIALISAGIGSPEFRTAVSGWESMLQVNTLGTAQCAILLLPILQRSGAKSGRPAVLEIVGSEAYLDVQEDWIPRDETILDHYSKQQNFTLDRQYHLCKLLIMFLQQGVEEAMKGKPNAPTFIVASPGMCRTNLGRDFPISMKLFMAVFQFFVARTAEQGARSLVSGAGLPSADSGHFWTNDTIDPRLPLLSAESWAKSQATEFARIVEVLDQACPGVRAALH